MDFQIHQAVDDVNAFTLQLSGPLDVALFVEAGFQFHQHCNLLAVVDGFEQGLDYRGVVAYAIESDFDGQHRGIARGFLQEGYDRLKRIEGVMEKNVLAADGGEDVFSLFLRLERGDYARDEGLVFQIGAVDGEKMLEPVQGQRAGHLVNVFAIEFQVLEKDLQDSRRACSG